MRQRILGHSIYRDKHRDWPSICACARALVCDPETVYRYLKSKKPINGYILERCYEKEKGHEGSTGSGINILS